MRTGGTPCLTVDESLLLQFNLNQFKRAAKILGIVFEGIHVNHLTCFRFNVFARPIRVRKLGFAVVQEDRNRLGLGTSLERELQNPAELDGGRPEVSRRILGCPRG